MGDGIHSDGLAMANLFNMINDIPGSDTVFVRLHGNYLLSGTPNRPMAPEKFETNKGNVKGLPAITRDNVVINATGSVFKVPADFPFRRLKRGGDFQDSFFIMFHFKGKNCTLLGGTLDGNLHDREVLRGPNKIGYGGNEFGLVMEGENWTLKGVRAQSWGTDCLLITTQGKSLDCVFTKARRNGVSVVAYKPISKVVISGGIISGNGDYPDDIANNPGAGVVVEGPALASVILERIIFLGNKLKDVQLSKNSLKCIIKSCYFTNRLALRPLQRGGHHIVYNKLMGAAYIHATTTVQKNEAVYLKYNVSENYEQKVGSLIKYTSALNARYRQRFIIE